VINFKQFLTEKLHHDAAEDFSHHEKISQRLGSNPGGIFKNPKTGEKHYIKFYNNADQAKSEVAASHVYHHLGVDTLHPKLVKHGDKLGVATKWSDEVSRVSPNYHKWSEKNKDQLAKHFVAGVATKNWDAIGLEHDNILKHKNGKLINGDLGGSFKFRAQGGHKDFGHDIAEHKSLRNPEYPAGQAFGHHVLSHEHIKKAVHGVHVDEDHIKKIFKESGLPDHEEHAHAVIARLHKMKEHYK
jgi:hypothetical protein